VGQTGSRGETSAIMFPKMKKRTKEKLYRTFTFGFLIIFVLSVVAALLITGLQAPVAR
jgi:hypothetical protein